MTERIARSVAFTVDVDEALADLATAEGTSRADLVRQGLTMLFRDRGIDLDAQAGIVTDRVAVAHQRNRRKAPIGDQAREALAAWWAEHAATIRARSTDPPLLDRVVDHLLANVERDGTIADDIPNHLLDQPATSLDAWNVDVVVRELLSAGAIKYQRKRRQPARIRLAPWLESPPSASAKPPA